MKRSIGIDTKSAANAAYLYQFPHFNYENKLKAKTD